MLNLRAKKISGILADEMGLGKTLEAISLLAYIRLMESIEGPHLVIIPKSTIPNWQREFKRWCPDIKVLILDGDEETRKKIVRERVNPMDFDALIVSATISVCGKVLICESLTGSI